MLRVMLAMLLVPFVALGAQTPPTPPTPPAPSPAPAPRVEPPRTPRAPRALPAPEFEWTREEAERLAREVEARVRDQQWDVEARVREQLWRVDRDSEFQARAEERAREAAARVEERLREQEWRMDERTHEQALRAAERVRERLENRFEFEMSVPFPPVAVAPVAPVPAIEPVPAPAPFAYRPSDVESRFLNQRPREPWAQGDPADSLYKVAREALNRGEYRRAADTFAEITRRFPNSAYAPQSWYWEAFARYRIGTTDELRLASRALDQLATRSAQLSRETDVSGLRARIDGALAVRGDRAAEVRVRENARSVSAEGGRGACDREDLAVRVEALSALAQMDPAAAAPTLRRVLERRDECSVELRRRAVFMLARRSDADAAGLIAGVARNDPSLEVRIEAMQYLMKLPGDVGVTTLEEILRTSDEERIQRAAVSALTRSDNPRARQTVRALLERRDASERLRIEAIGRFDKERSSSEDAAYLRAHYGRVESERIKESVLSALARIGGQENEDFLMAVARNPEEPPSMRAAALGRLSRSPTLSITDLVKLYDVADTRSMREQVIGALANRKENEATDKLIDIARNSTDYTARRQAISALTRRRNDPRAAAAIRELVEK